MSKDVEVKWIVEPDGNIDFDLSESKEALNKQISMMTANPDNFDIAIAVASGVVCGFLDAMCLGKFDIKEGKKITDNFAQEIIVKTSKMFGNESNDIQVACSFLEKHFKIPSDGNTSSFGGGLQHHLRDFAHHPTAIGLLSSIMTQFTGMVYGTDVSGMFQVLPVNKGYANLIGKTVFEKIFNGTVVWFFHLVSDMAGSSGSIGNCGGTGIPGPILALAKELSILDIFKVNNDSEKTASEIISKLFNGTFFAKRDSAGKLIRESVVGLDLRAEIGSGIELAKVSIPVMLNECIVRTFYALSRMCTEMKRIRVAGADQLLDMDLNSILPLSNPTLNRMLTISEGVFSAIDIVDAVVKRNVLEINVVGIGRLAVSLGVETVGMLRIHELRETRRTYQRFEDNVYHKNESETGKLLLNKDQVEILYNLEFLLIENDIIRTSKSVFGDDKIIRLKSKWLSVWKDYISSAFPALVKCENATITWYQHNELSKRIESMNPFEPWFKMVILYAITFEPYFALKIIESSDGKKRPEDTYKTLASYNNKFSKDDGGAYIDLLFSKKPYYMNYAGVLYRGYSQMISRLRKENADSFKGKIVHARKSVAKVVEDAIVIGVSSANPLVGLVSPVLITANAIDGICALVEVGDSAISGVNLLATNAINAIQVYNKDVAIANVGRLMVAVRFIYGNDSKVAESLKNELLESLEIISEELSVIAHRKEKNLDKEKLLIFEKQILLNALDEM